MSRQSYDLILRGGTVIDGTGADRRTADVAIKDGLIAAVGSGDAGALDGDAAEEIDASGLLVTPGFVDIHTHYDGQATWAERMQPSSWHGVTTVVMGNCGVGFAPCKPEDRERLIRLMEGVEDIPNPVMTEGLPWNWQSFPEYLDALDARVFDVDIGVQLAHSPLRVFVMGERGANREPATEAEMKAMADIAEEAMKAGAIGFSSANTINHKTADGEKVPTYAVAEQELFEIAKGLKAAKAGVLQMITDFEDPLGDFDRMRRLVKASDRPLSFSFMERPAAPDDWRILLKELDAAGDEGLPIRGQVPCRPIGVLLGLEGSANPFFRNPVYQEIAKLSLAERVERLSDAEFRGRMMAAQGGLPTATMLSLDNCYPLDQGAPDYEPDPETSVNALAAKAGASPEDYALDHMLQDGGRGLLLVPIFNYARRNLEVSREMLESAYTVPGLSDGGAHMGVICDGSFPTTLLQHWTRDRTRGQRFTVEQVVKMQARDTALTVGLEDRGLIQPGMRADINVIDYDRLNSKAPEFAYDLPAGGRHLVQRATGYRYTIVAGQVTYRDGEATGALPGRLVRGAKPAPVAA